jgi:hypothetical protein
MTQTEALRLASEALTVLLDEWTPARQAQLKGMEAVTAIKAALEAKDEPVAWMYEVNHAHTCLDLFEPPDDAYDEGTLYPLYTHPSQQEAKDEPVAHSVVAGALFDFMGWLTSREKRLILSSVDEASPAVEAITEFAKKRNLSLKYAEVGYWMEFLSTPPQQEAKDEPVAWMDASRFEELRNGFTVMTTLTKKKAFFDDIAIYATPPQRKPLQVDKDGWYWLSENECIHVDLIRKVEEAHGIK